MFGYIRACPDQWNDREKEIYKAYYCGLCKELGKRFGFISRLTLNFEYVFLAILAANVRKCPEQIGQETCVAHPVKKRPVQGSNSALGYASDVASLMIYHKLRDDMADEGFFRKIKAGAILVLAKKPYKKACRNLPELAKTIATQIARQYQTEKESGQGIDEACDPTATCLQAIFEQISEDENPRRILSRMGYLLGRYVYMADALADLEEDTEQQRFNPFYGISREEAAASIRMTIAEVGVAYDLLDRGDYTTILDNIIYLGLGAVAKELQKPREQRKGDIQ